MPHRAIGGLRTLAGAGSAASLALGARVKGIGSKTLAPTRRLEDLGGRRRRGLASGLALPQISLFQLRRVRGCC